MEFRRQWRLYGMWALLDLVLIVLLFNMVPVLLGINIARGLFYYAHVFVMIIAVTLIVGAFVAFHRGCMVNLCHNLLRTADQWWRWIVFHWALAIFALLASSVMFFVAGPLLSSQSLLRFVGIGLFVLYALWLLHIVSLSQYFYMEKQSIMWAISSAMRRQFHKRLRKHLTTIILYEFWIFAAFRIVEFIMGIVLSPSHYETADIYLVYLFYISAAVVFYILTMRNRARLFGRHA